MPQKSIEQYERELMEMYRLALAKDPNYAALAQRQSAATVRESIPEKEKIDVEIPAPGVEESVPLPDGITPLAPEQQFVMTEEVAMPEEPDVPEQSDLFESPVVLEEMTAPVAVVASEETVMSEESVDMMVGSEPPAVAVVLPVPPIAVAALEEAVMSEGPADMMVESEPPAVAVDLPAPPIAVAVSEEAVMSEGPADMMVESGPPAVAVVLPAPPIAVAASEEAVMSEGPADMMVESEPPAVAVVLPAPEMVTPSDDSVQSQKQERSEMTIKTDTQESTDTTIQSEVVAATETNAKDETPPPAQQQMPANMGRTTPPASELWRTAKTTPNIGAGNLIVNVTTLNRTKPVAGAVVTVSHPEASGNKVVAKIVTDSSGKTELVRLPAPIREIPIYPQPMTGGDLSAKYLVTVEAPGFRAVSDEEVSIFDGVTSVKRVDLTSNTGDENGVVVESSGAVQRE